MRPITVTAGPLAAPNAALFAASATPVSGTPLTLLTTTPDKPRRVLLTYGNEGAPRTLVLVGTNWAGNPITETLAVPAGAGGTVGSVLDYATLTSATPLGAGWTAAATLGTSGIASSPWVRLDDYGFVSVSLEVEVTGTVNYTVEQSADDPNTVAPLTPVAPASMVWLAHPLLQGQTLSMADGYSFKPKFTRLTLNSSTAGAGNLASMTVIQAGGKLG